MRYGLILFVGLLLLNACDKGENPLGPDIDKVFGDFEIIDSFTVSQNTVFFPNDESVTFNARFAAYEDWELTITGLTSGSYKKYSGFGDVVAIEWLGSSSVLPVLKEENCSVVFTVANENYTETSELTIEAVKENEGVLVSNFESGLPASLPHFYQSGVNFFADDASAAGQGNRYMNAGGTVPWDYLIGLIEFPALNTVGQSHYPLSTNEHLVHFNAMIEGDENLPATFIIWRFREDDNGDGIWSGDTEDMWVTGDIPVTESGWQLYTTPYDSLVISAEGAGASGNNLREPEKLLSVEYLLLIDPAKGEARCNLDFLIFTEGGPLQP